MSIYPIYSGWEREINDTRESKNIWRMKSMKLRIRVGLNFDRKGSLETIEDQKKEYGREVSVFSDLAGIWLLFSQWPMKWELSEWGRR